MDQISVANGTRDTTDNNVEPKVSPLLTRYKRNGSICEEKPSLTVTSSSSLPLRPPSPTPRTRRGSINELDVPIPREGLLKKVLDVDDKINYMRKSSLMYGHPLDLTSISSPVYTNHAFAPDDDQEPPKTMFTIPVIGLPEDTSTESNKTAKGDDDCLTTLVSKWKDISRRCETSKWVKWLLFILYNVYWVFAVYRTWHKTPSCCDGVKFLTVLTCLVYFIILYSIVLKRHVIKPLYEKTISRSIRRAKDSPFIESHLQTIIWSLVLLVIVIYSMYITTGDRQRLVSGAGIGGFIVLGYLLSANRSKIKWQQVFWGLSLQFALALLVLRTRIGKSIFQCLGEKITTFLKFTDNGSEFLFGYLVSGRLNGEDIPTQFAVFAFKILPVIIFFSFFVSILYFYGVMQVLVVKVGFILEKTIGTTSCESLSASANIFLGMTEAPLIIKPYVPLMTKSELFAVMTGGFATIAGSVLAAYINFGVNASHLLSASVMAAPAALGMSKLFYPETEISRTHAKDITLGKGVERNALEAAANGASQATKLCANIAANLIAFLAFIKFLDSLVSWFGQLVDMDFITFEWILSKLFVPIAALMGVEWHETEQVAKLIGLKTLVNEFVAYKQLGEMKTLKSLSARSQMIATYALCGFSNFASIGVQLGALGALVPQRTPDLAGMAFRAMIAGSTTTFISASMAGLLSDEVSSEVSLESLSGKLLTLNNTMT